MREALAALTAAERMESIYVTPHVATPGTIGPVNGHNLKQDLKLN